jgi:multiple antibiotic resistance protein
LAPLANLGLTVQAVRFYAHSVMSLAEYIFLVASSLFVIVDPIASVPAFIAMTAHDDPEQRIRMARLACCVVAAVLLVFAIGGEWVFKLLGITMPAFQIAASIVLLLIALDMVRAQRSRVQQTLEETTAGAEKTDIAITPLAIPMLAGPGAISTVIVLEHRATGVPQHLALYVCIVGIAMVSYMIFRFSARSTRWLSPIITNIMLRIMGMMLASVAIQFLLDAINTLRQLSAK